MYLLEYDDERSGGFEPLRHLLPGKMVTLGLITSKTGKLEDKKVIVQRILDAARYAPLNQLSVGMQCGFSSTVHGNELTPEQQWEKLNCVKRSWKKYGGKKSRGTSIYQ